MPTSRTFKSSLFSKKARKAAISDAELCEAMKQVRNGQAEDLGGGVFKKRLNDNEDRSIILAKGRRFWIYEYLYSKQDKANIKQNELKDFRTLAKAYATLTGEQIKKLLADGALLEICLENPNEIQE
jgi:hypothetical protein